MAGTTTTKMDSINLDQACKFLIQDDPDFKKQVKAMILENLRVPESTTTASTAHNPTGSGSGSTYIQKAHLHLGLTAPRGLKAPLPAHNPKDPGSNPPAALEFSGRDDEDAPLSQRLLPAAAAAEAQAKKAADKKDKMEKEKAEAANAERLQLEEAQEKIRKAAEAKAALPYNGRKPVDFHFKPWGDDHNLNVRFNANQVRRCPAIAKNNPSPDEILQAVLQTTHLGVGKYCLSKYASIADQKRPLTGASGDYLAMRDEKNSISGKYIRLESQHKILQEEFARCRSREQQLLTNQKFQASALTTKVATIKRLEAENTKLSTELTTAKAEMKLVSEANYNYWLLQQAAHGAQRPPAQRPKHKDSRPETRQAARPRPTPNRTRRRSTSASAAAPTRRRTSTSSSAPRHPRRTPDTAYAKCSGDTVVRGSSLVLSRAEVEALLRSEKYTFVAHMLPVCYVWKKTHKAMNKLFHILWGNGTKLITKLTTDGMPKLKSDVQDAEGFLSWCLDFKSWTRVQGITAYVVGPLPARPADGADARPSWDAKTAEGLRYLCTAILDNDLKSNVASNSENADHVANGPTAYEFLKTSMLQRTAEAPAYQQVLDGLRYRIDGNIVSFQSRFTKFANALAPRPAENILCQKYVLAITADTSATFEAEVTTTIAMDDQSDFNRFASKLTMLISQKSTRLTAARQNPVGQHAHANNSNTGGDSKLLEKMSKQIAQLEAQLGASDDRRNGGRRNDRRPGNPPRNSDPKGNNPKRRCHKCGKAGCDGSCNANPVCDFTFGNGEKCGGKHLREFCYYEDPSRCRDPKLRRIFERKLQAKSTSSNPDAHMAAQSGEEFCHVIEIIEKPLPGAKSPLELPDDIVTTILPMLDDTSLITLATTCSQAKFECSGQIAEKMTDAYHEAWREGYTSPQVMRKFKEIQERDRQAWEDGIKNWPAQWQDAYRQEFDSLFKNNAYIPKDVRDAYTQIPYDGYCSPPPKPIRCVPGDHKEVRTDDPCRSCGEPILKCLICDWWCCDNPPCFDQAWDKVCIKCNAAETITAMSTPKGYTEELENFMFIDTGASDHIVCDPKMLILPEEHKPVDIEIRTGNGTTKAKSRGPAKITVRDSSGKKHDIIRTVIFCPDFRVNLFSPQRDWRDHKTKTTFEDTCKLQLDDGTVIPFEATGNMFKMYYYPPKTDAHTTMDLPMRDSPEWLWHRRMGHQSFEKLRLLPTSSVGVTLNISTEQVRQHAKECSVCPLARMKAKPHSKNETPTALTSKYGDRIHMDLAGPMRESYQKKFRYVTIFVDEHTGHIGLYCIRTKDEHQDAHLQYVADMAGVGGMEIREFHSDNGGEFMSNEYIKMIQDDGAKKTTSSPYTPNLNNIPEGAFWRIFSIVRALLTDSGMPKIHWSSAAQQAAYILNRTPTQRKKGGNVITTPYERLFGRKPNLQYLKLWGCLAHGFIPKPTRTGKLNQVAISGINYGNSRYQRGWKIYIPGQNKVIDCHTVTFDEKVVYKDIINFGPPKEVTIASNSDSSDDSEDEVIQRANARRVRPPRIMCTTPGCTQLDGHLGPHTGQERGGGGLPSSSMRQRAQINYNEDSDFADVLDMHLTKHVPFDEFYSDGVDVVAHATSKRKDEKEVKTDTGQIVKIAIPRTFQEAMQSPDKDSWFAAMDTEYKAHLDNGTWELVPMSEVTPGRKIVGSTWAYDVKKNDDGTLSRYKARFCAQGFSQIEGVDFINTYSNTVHHDTLRLMFAVAAALGMRLTGADVKTAYLYGIIDTLVYMKQPRGYEKYGPDGHAMVCKLRKSIYGLRQSGARWEATLVEHLLKLGFARCEFDPCLFKIHEGPDVLLLCVYVDDLCFASTSDSYRTKIFSKLTERFQLTDTGDLTWILNTNISQDLTAGTVTVSQKTYIEEAVRKFFPNGLPEKSGRLVPCDEALSNLEPLGEGELIDPAYRSGVGMLVWLTSISRPDVAFTHSMLARHNCGGGERHMKHLMKVFEYLGRTAHYKITYSRASFTKLCKFISEHSKFNTDVLQLTSLLSMVDSSHGGERPMAGDAHFVAGAPIGWRAGRHTVTPLNVASGEYMVATKAVVTIIPHRAVLEFMGLKQEDPTIIFTDSTAAVMIADSNTSSKRMKHIATRLAFLREQIAAKTAEMYHIRTTGQIADIFTKPLIAATFHNLRELLLGP